MTMFAKVDKRLTRLFRRLDSALTSTDEHVNLLHQAWLDRRGQKIAPDPESFLSPSSEAAGGGLVLRAEPDNRYRLVSGLAAAKALLGSCSGEGHLEKAADKRGVVRLRSLMRFVEQTGEPIIGCFTTRPAPNTVVDAELYVAPLSSDGRTIDAFLAAANIRQVVTQGRRFVPHWRRPHPLLFALEGSRVFGERLAIELELPISPLEERSFDDGEKKCRPLADVCGRDVFVVSGLERDASESVHDRLLKLLFFIATLKTNGAARVTAIAPYLPYMRKDRQTKAQDPLTAAYVARFFETAGTDCLITMETHNLAAFQNAFRCRAINLVAYEAFAGHFAKRILNQGVTVVSPDLGGAKRAEMFRERLETRLDRPVGLAFMEKQRSQGIVSGDLFAGDVDDRFVIILDDLISSGTTMLRAAKACAERGAKEIHLCATHAVFSKPAAADLSAAFIDGIVVSDSIALAEPYRSDRRIAVIPVAHFFAEAAVKAYEAGAE